MSRVKDLSAREVYIKAAIDGSWSRSMLERQIATEYHKRIGASTNNFKQVLPAEDGEAVNEMIKDPYIEINNDFCMKMGLDFICKVRYNNM